MFRVIFKFIFFIAEKVAAEIALLVSLLTLTRQGSYDDRFWGALDLIWRIVEGFVTAFIKKVNFIDVINNFAAAAKETISKAGENIEGDPQAALATLVGAFILMKLAALALRLIRHKLLKKRPKDSADNTPETGTYEKLYQGESDQAHISK